MRVLDCKDEACRAVAAEAPIMVEHLCDACDAHFDAVIAGVRAAGLEPVITPTLVRGLDYYTRTAFEFVSDALQEGGNAQQATLFGGGRYDGLAEALGGPHVPGVGFGMGLERVLLAVADEGLERRRSSGRWTPTWSRSATPPAPRRARWSPTSARPASARTCRTRTARSRRS